VLGHDQPLSELDPFSLGLLPSETRFPSLDYFVKALLAALRRCASPYPPLDRRWLDAKTASQLPDPKDPKEGGEGQVEPLLKLIG